MIICLSIRLAYRVTQEMKTSYSYKMDIEEVENQLQLNLFQASLHITLVFATTVSAIIYFYTILAEQ